MNFKCIVDPCAVSEVSVHHFHTREFGDRTANNSGEVFPLDKRKSPDFYSSRHLQLNHYYTRSEEEFAQEDRAWRSFADPLGEAQDEADDRAAEHGERSGGGSLDGGVP